MKKQRGRSKTRKGGLGKNALPGGSKTRKGGRGKIRDKKNENMKKLAKTTRNSGKNERLDEPKTWKGGSCKNEIETEGNWLYLANHHPLEARATDEWPLSSEAATPVNSKFLGTVVTTVFNVPPTNKITIFQTL